jgi:hypothetical protein
MGYKLTSKAHTDYGRISCLFMHMIEWSFDAGKTHSLCPLMAFIESKTRKASLLNGTL